MSDSSVSDTVREAILAFQAEPGGLMPALWAVQNVLGYIPEEEVPTIAKAMNQSVAEVHGVISFYHDFKSRPPAAHTVKICRAEACQAMGGRRLQAFAEQQLGVEFDQASSSAVALESVYCLGLCACAPAAMVDGKLVAKLDEDRLATILAGLHGKGANNG